MILLTRHNCNDAGLFFRGQLGIPLVAAPTRYRLGVRLHDTNPDSFFQVFMLRHLLKYLRIREFDPQKSAHFLQHIELREAPGANSARVVEILMASTAK